MRHEEIQRAIGSLFRDAVRVELIEVREEVNVRGIHEVTVRAQVRTPIGIIDMNVKLGPAMAKPKHPIFFEPKVIEAMDRLALWDDEVPAKKKKAPKNRRAEKVFKKVHKKGRPEPSFLDDLKQIADDE